MAAWLVLGLLHLLPGAVALVAPTWFAIEVAGIPADTPHFARDVGVAELTLAAAALLAAGRRWARPAAVVVLGVHLLLHAVSHVVDRAAAPAEANAAVAASLLVQAGLLVLAAREVRRARPAAPGRGPKRPTA